MCGINGLVSFNTDFDVCGSLTLMNERIRHRGPDDFGFYQDVLNGSVVGLSMRRLAIIDLENGNQPFISDDGNYVIVFNGEVYNFRKLKEDLKLLGSHFVTKSDTEVVLKLFIRFGVDSFKMLDGMFALTIYDKRANLIYVARDFFGEKPLYFSKQQDTIYWSSELKAILPLIDNNLKIDKDAMLLYFQLKFIPAPYTIYENVKKLCANHFLKICTKTGDIDIKEIQQIVASHNHRGFDDAVRITHDMVQNSVETRSIADVALGSFLSGGVDSSIVTMILSKSSFTPINTFTIAFKDKKFDESNNAKLVAEIVGSRHHEILLGKQELVDVLDDVLFNFDEPFADPAALPCYIVAREAKKHVKVVLTGDGGDELFGGYNRYLIGHLNHKVTNIIPRSMFDFFKTPLNHFFSKKHDLIGFRHNLLRTINSICYDDCYYRKVISLGFQYTDIPNLLNYNFYSSVTINPLTFFFEENPKGFKEFRENDRKLSLDGGLMVKSDRTSMLASVESRSPFLNKELWSFTSQLEEDFLIDSGKNKIILKKAFENYFPKNFFNVPKKGFRVPVGELLRDDLKLELLKYSNKDFLLKQGFFNYDYIFDLIKKHNDRTQDRTSELWCFFCFQKWFVNSQFYTN